MNSKILFIILIILIIFSNYQINIIKQNELIKNNKDQNYNSNISIDTNNYEPIFYSTSILEDFFWPLPGYNRISSPFGKRTSPTKGSSSYHQGIDIPAPQGTSIFSVLSGTVIFTGFKGAGGHTISIKSNNMIISYCHVSPNYRVSVGQEIKKGELISTVGPKYINDVINNPYKDSTGKNTNGATTGCHLHLGIKNNGQFVNPLQFFK